MNPIKVGEFEINVMTGGHPIWFTLSYRGEKLDVGSINSLELRDLQYAVKQARRRSRQEAQTFDPDRIADY